MDPAEVTPEASPDDNCADESQPQEPSPTTDNKDNPPAKKANVRKRTKTGCLTCRKRRIKCDEGKPTCNNCIKSKRQCEGYNTRVIFKEPMGTFQGGPFGPIVYRPDPTDALVSAQLSSAQSKSSSSQGGPLPIIAPKPPSVDFGTPATFQYAQAYQAPRTDSSSSMSFNHMPYRSHYHAGNPPPFPSDSQRKPSYHGHTERNDTFHYYNASETASHIHPARDDVPHSIRQQPDLHRPDRPDLISPTENPHAAYIGPATEDEYWYSDDDASMGESDDEFGAEQHAANLASNDLGVLVARRLHAPFDMYGTQVRSFHTFADDNILATYIPSSTNSPLNDAQTAAIFWYFVNVTGPSMSLYERHPFDPSPMFQGEPVPKTKQHIWTYTFPIISFNHPALLQAMLALGSLQMAKLQGVPATASMKHYHLSLRRVAKNYQSNSRRAQPATLAATLLLGFYEVWNSDHDKWCKHMWGARAIIKEIPLRQMTQSILAMKRRRRQRLEELRRQQQYDGFIPSHNDYIDNDVEDVDVNLVRELTGRPICFEDDYGAPPQANIRYTERDLENYEHVSDLYWWYCKMDVYQSFLGATKLFLEYEKWTQCIPRAPIGRIDAIYGTFDHLMLVLGRLASFASIDMARKRRAMKERGGPGGPGRPGGPGGPGGGRGGPPGPPGQGNSPPMFAGMMPSSGRVTVPSGFSPPRDMPSTEGSDEVDLDTSTKAALEEWTAIRRAFEVFKSKLGPDFEPMSSEFEPPQATPFGLALTYRTYSIAGIWMNYYMGMIALYRAHPSMPPFAMVAAGMAARSTAGYAIEIGRIAAGLAEDCTTVSAVSTLVGAAFIESCFCLFVAGVQYQDPVQRHWTIKRLHDIARLTGWQSARQIANGCESAWRKAAELGHGLPYERDPNLAVEEHESVWQNPRRIDARIKELSGDEDKLVLAKSERAHYALGLLSVEQDLEKLDLQERG